MLSSPRLLFAFCAVSAVAFLATPAHADYVVVSSESPKFVVGQQIPEAAEIEISGEDQLRVMDQVSGETDLLEGPYKGTISAYKRSCRPEGGACRPGERDQPVGGSRALKRETH